MRLNILIVEDSPDDVELIKRSLKKTGFQLSFLEAQSAEEAIAIVNNCKKPIDCIFLDYMLPDMDGISMLRKIYNKEDGLCPYPVVMMTGQGSEAVAADAICSGAQDYLMKENISTDTLHTAIVKAQQVFELRLAHNRARAMLEHSQKMEAVGKLTGGIAHDFNNLLTIMFGNTRQLSDLLEQQEIDPEASKSKVESIQRASQRGADLVKRLMAFARNRRLDPITVDINKELEEIEIVLQRTLGDDIDVRSKFSDEIYYVDIDMGQFEHAVINMGLNARDAMGGGGILTLSTENVHLDETKAARLNVDPGPYVRFSLADTGEGIPDEIKHKIFDPFFTTKSIGKGTGLGLSLVYDFARESGGVVNVEDNESGGTTFSLYLPKSEESLLTILDHEDIPEASQGHERIIVVEDEHQIRDVVSSILRESGYTVLPAASAQEAIDIIQNKSNKIDLMFIDVALPGDMNGIQMADYIHVMEPEMKFLFTSGYIKPIEPEKDSTIRNYDILYKPYRPEVLMRKIRKVLEG